MARLSFAGLDGIAQELSRMGEKADGIITEMLNAGAVAVEDAWKQAISEAGLIKTGEMQASVKGGKVQKSVSGGYVEVYPRGTDSKGVGNAEKAFINHYGTSRVPATGFVDRAEELGEETAAIIMTQIWESQN